MALSTKSRRLFVLGIVVVAFCTLTARTEHQDAQIRDLIHRQETEAFMACQNRVDNIVSTNTLRRQLAEIATDPREAAAYRSAVLAVPDCGPRP